MGAIAAPTPRRIHTHDGLALRAWDYGGEGPALILCHCTGTCARIWDPVVARLEGAFRVVAIDSRAHGDSEAPPTRAACRWTLSGRDILTVADTLGMGKGVWAAGHSGGAAHVAYAELLRPGRFARIALIDAICGPPKFFEGENRLAAQARRRRNAFDRRETAHARFASKPPMASWMPEALDAYIAHALADCDDGRVVLKCAPYVEAWMYELGGAFDCFGRLDEVRCPALIVTGEHSEIAPLAHMQAARLPDAELHTLRGVGHFCPQEDPEAIALLLREWFGKSGAA